MMIMKLKNQHPRIHTLLRKYLSLCAGVTFIVLCFTAYSYNTKREKSKDEDGWTSSLRQRTSHLGKPSQSLPNKLEHGRHPYLYLQSDQEVIGDLTEEVTIVTLYINIGRFQKDTSYFTPELYRKWMKTFAMLQNPVVAYFDQETEREYFLNLRGRLGANRTVAVLIDRSKLWAFDLLESIKEIFSQPNYPRHHPNTVYPEYSCVMHAKYELMTKAIKTNYFHTRYFAWLDIGLFRALSESKSLSFFEIWLPPNFNSSTVAYTEVFDRLSHYKPEFIIRSNAVWVCGAFFIGKADVLTRWAQEYMRATEALIKNHHLMSTDQQVLYVLYNWGHPKIQIQTYRNPNRGTQDWFYLGYLCKEEAYKKQHNMSTKSVVSNKYMLLNK